MWSSGIRHHQQINRVALKKLAELTSVSHFPDVKQINKFEGSSGPDNMKPKGGSHEVPHQYYDPFDDEDTEIIHGFMHHFNDLVEHLKEGNEERAAFEAAWLAHLLVDGLTPAHHHPYNEELEGLAGENTELIRSDLVRISAETISEAVKHNWKIWGARGIITSHILFEGGVAAISAPLNAKTFEVTKHDINEAKDMGLFDYFMKKSREVALLNLYDNYMDTGWTSKLARTVRDELMPQIFKLVTVAWYLALAEAGYATKPAHK